MSLVVEYEGIETTMQQEYFWLVVVSICPVKSAGLLNHRIRRKYVRLASQNIASKPHHKKSYY